MKDNWLVTVVVDNQNIISISDGHISGIGDVSDYEDEIRECAKHLLGFIGELGQLESRPTKRAPDVEVCACKNVPEPHRGTWLICGVCLKPRRG